MLKFQLLSDPEFTSTLTDWLQKVEAIELVSTRSDVVLDLAFLNPARKLQQLSQLDLGSALVITNTLTMSATNIRQALGAGNPLVGAPLFPNYFGRQKLVEFMLPFGAQVGVQNIRETVTTSFNALGKESEQIEDAIAGVFPRSLAMIINEAAFAVQEGVANAQDVDTAMKLGTNYPLGPLAWCDEIGAVSVVATLDALAREYGQDRYKVATRLRRMAETNGKFYDFVQ